MNHLADALLFLPVVLAFFVLGGALAGPGRSAAENAVLPGSLALGLYALLVWAAGSCGLLLPALWTLLPWPLLLALFVWRRTRIVATWKEWASALAKVPSPDLPWLLFLVAAWAVTFFLTLAPPNGAEYDSLTYHLAVPAQNLRQGRVLELRYDHHSYFPFTLEMLYTLGLWAHGPVLAKLFHWLMLPVGCLAMLAIGGRLGGRRAGLLAASLYASLPLVLSEATTAYIDLGFVAYVLLATLCLLNALAPEETGAQGGGQKEWLLWSGAFVGLCLGTKYFGALVLGFPGLWLLALVLRRRLEPAALLKFAVPALLVGLPWYVRNWLWTGNPVYPFAYEIFGGAGWTKEMARQYTHDQAYYGFGRNWQDLAWLPWRLGMAPLGADSPYWPLRADIRATAPYLGVFDVKVLDVLLRIFPGPMLLALGLPALVTRPKPPRVVFLTSFFLFLWIFWAFTSQQIRYLLPGLALLCVISAWGVIQWDQKFAITRIVARLGLGLWCCFALLLQVSQASDQLPVLLGQVSDQQYLSRSFRGYDAMQWANTATPATAKFAVYGEPRCYYLKRDYIWADDEHNNLLDYAALKDVPQFCAALKKLGITHLLVNTEPGKSGGAFGLPAQFQGILGPQGPGILYASRGYAIVAVP